MDLLDIVSVLGGLLALSLAFFALRSIRQAPPASPHGRFVQRVRFQFAALALAWSLALVGVVLSLLFDVAPARVLLMVVIAHGALLLLAFPLAAALYRSPTEANPA